VEIGAEPDRVVQLDVARAQVELRPPPVHAYAVDAGRREAVEADLRAGDRETVRSVQLGLGQLNARPNVARDRLTADLQLQVGRPDLQLAAAAPLSRIELEAPAQFRRAAH